MLNITTDKLQVTKLSWSNGTFINTIQNQIVVFAWICIKWKFKIISFLSQKLQTELRFLWCCWLSFVYLFIIGFGNDDLLCCQQNLSQFICFDLRYVARYLRVFGKMANEICEQKACNRQKIKVSCICLFRILSLLAFKLEIWGWTLKVSAFSNNLSVAFFDIFFTSNCIILAKSVVERPCPFAPPFRCCCRECISICDTPSLWVKVWVTFVKFNL